MKIYTRLIDETTDICLLCTKDDQPIPVRFFGVVLFATREDVLVKARVCDKCYLHVGINGTGRASHKKMVLFHNEWDIIEELEFTARL